MDKHYVDGRVTELGSQLYEVKREVNNLMQTVTMLTAAINTKANKGDVQQMIEQSELIKRINESESVGMDSMVRVELDGER
ncbi:hypothetical protein [Bacillus toyonensis]|uniref:hypothetical protein n=1 Tax=Bacillus toyonensis TaxID=155322 RepID=UPI000BF37307|nr:hypothetical protein [Bacillus toyonensis]PGB05372.1 hypothetical protein COL96_28405 [Bacillus toyonensis]